MSISATIFGRLTGDPQQKMPQNGGNQYVSFSVASNTGRKDANGNNGAQFVNISAFGRQGDIIMQYFHKGSRICVNVAKLEARAWTDQSGQARVSIDAVLNDFDFVDTAAENGQQPQAAQQRQQYAQPQQYRQAQPPMPQQQYRQVPPPMPQQQPQAVPPMPAQPQAAATPWG